MNEITKVVFFWPEIEAEFSGNESTNELMKTCKLCYLYFIIILNSLYIVLIFIFVVIYVKAHYIIYN